MPKALVESLRAQRAATLQQLERLGSEQWEAPCLPPWRVRDVVAHLVAVDEASLTGRAVVVLQYRDRAAVERWNDRSALKLAAVDPEDLLQRLRRAGARMASVTRLLPPVLDRFRVTTAFGRLSLRSLLCVRVLDEWVHSVDIADVTGVPSTLPASVPQALATAVLARLPGVTLPLVQRPVGVLHLEVGIGERGQWQGHTRHWGVDFARRQFGPSVRGAADATVQVHASTLALLAERRISWREALPGSLQIEGDPEVAAGLLDVIAA